MNNIQNEPATGQPKPESPTAKNSRDGAKDKPTAEPNPTAQSGVLMTDEAAASGGLEELGSEPLKRAG
ncbi:MAG: hypothetical protein EXR21_04895 [Flavobacteriaceae bacterium]|nr:hypothetical protein [Flavobacteriaceae bacterium]